VSLSDLLRILEILQPFVFGLLALIALLQYRRHRSAPAAWAALTFVILGAILIVSAVLPEEADTPTLRFTGKAIIAVFALFPYSLYRFMASFRSPPRWLDSLALALTLLVMIGPFLFERLPEEGEPRTAAFGVYLLLFLGHFVLLSLIVSWKLWRSGKDLPAVSRKRMRTLSLGSLALATAVILAVAAPSGESPEGFQVTVQLFALGSALLFLLGFAPPATLRSAWRRSEGPQLDAAEAGLMEAQTAEDIARVILPRVATLAGGRQALLLSGSGEVLGHYSSGERDGATSLQEAASQERIVRVPVGNGELVVEASEFAPLFGDDEVQMIKRVAFLAELAVQRALLVESQLRIQQQLVEAQAVARVGSWEWDVRTDGTVWSEQMFHLIGADPATTESTAALYRSRIHPDDLMNPEEELTLAFAAGGDYESEHRLIRLDGDIINVRSRAKTVFDDAGRPMKMIGTSQDVTEEKKLEAFRTQFIANAAHELRTPLTSLLGFIEIITSQRDKMTEEQVEEAFEVMSRSGERLSTLVQNMLDLTKLQQGTPDITLGPVDLQQVVHRALEANPPPAGVEVSKRVPSVTAKGDPNRLDQIVTNLLTNAYKYGGKRVAVDVEQSDGRVLLSVTDDGPGVDPLLVPNLFDPFTRGRESHRIRGSGLGLSIVKMLIEASEGSIRYEPAVPQGARFCVELRAAES